MIETVLAVDIGTTSLKAGLITAAGEVVSFSKYKFIDPNDRFIASKWYDALRISLNKMRQQLKALNITGSYKLCIKAVGISGNGPTVVSKSGMTLRWNENYEIDKTYVEKSLFLPKIIAFKDLFPQEFEKSQYIFSGPEYLIYELTGKAVTVLPEDRFISAYWTNEQLENLKIPVEKLPEFIGLGKKIGNLTEKTIFDYKLKDFAIEEIPVFSCGPDFTAALVGTGTLSPGRICDRSGSSEGFNFCIDRPVPCQGLRLLPSVIPGLWNISALLSTSSKLSENKRLEKVYQCMEKLRAYAKENNFYFPASMTVTGGQTMNKSWMSKKAHKLNIKLEVCRFSNSELLGDACAAWYGLGKFNSLQEAADIIVVKDE